MMITTDKHYFSVSAPKLESTGSAWSPKKEYFEVSKQLEKARRRIQLLKIENDLKEKKLQVYQQRSEQLNKIREDHEQFKEYKQFHKQQVNVQLQNLVSRTRNLKHKQNQDKLNLQQSLIQMRQSEVKSLKEQSIKNEQLIRQNIDTLKQQKFEQKQSVHNSELLAQQTITNFKKQRYLKHLQDHQLSKSQINIDTEMKLSQIEELKRQEAYLKIKLDENKELAEKSRLNSSLLLKQSSPTPKTASNFYY